MSRFSGLEARKPGWDTPLMVEAHINGVRSKMYNPNIPTDYWEITEEALRCWEAGATAIHAHNTNIALHGREAADDYLRSWRPVLEKYPEVFWYCTGSAPDPLDPGASGLEHAELLAREAGLEVCVVDPGSANLSLASDENGNLTGIPYNNDNAVINRQVALCERSRLGCVWGVYETGYLRTALHYIRHGRSPKGSTIDLYFIGDYGLTAMQGVNTAGAPPRVESLYYYLDILERSEVKLPWFISVWGAGSQLEGEHYELLRRAIELGGHIKTGLEMHFDPQDKPGNLDLIRQVRDIARDVGRPIASQAEARKLYGLA